mmetsp:Transcript_41408/g.65612  ORF Transcript_41408/g.65612 Transcript_41408/m.65612 type:complete len:267 (-) Transcript_41408:658-1458(-)
MLDLPFLCCLGHCGARHVRKTTLQWIGVVQPLSEKAAMKRHNTSMPERNVVKTPYQIWRKRSRCFYSRRRKAGDNGGNDGRLFLRCGDVLLKMTNQALAFIFATYRIKARRRNAICLRSEVIRNDNAWVLLVELVDYSELSQVVNILSELPLPIPSWLIKIGQLHAPSSLSLHLHQCCFQFCALSILEASKLLTNCCHDFRQGCEIQGTSRCACAYTANKLLRFLPSNKYFWHHFLQGSRITPGHVYEILSKDVTHHVSIEQFVSV